MISDKIKSTLRSLGVTPKKERGQNFLVDPAAVQEIVRFGRPDNTGSVIEIGPGLGALTAELASYNNLSVIEIESNFCRYIEKQFPNVNVIESDVRLVDFSELGDDLTVFGNLPYSISTDVIVHLSGFAKNIKRAVVMLQKEFAERLAATPGSRDYGVITITCQMYADVRLGPVIKGTSFYPEAGVDSQVLELRFLKEPRCTPKDTYTFNRLIATAFHSRRKKILNSLKASNLFPNIDWEIAFKEAKLASDLRPENLSIQDFCALSDAMSAQMK